MLVKSREEFVLRPRTFRASERGNGQNLCGKLRQSPPLGRFLLLLRYRRINKLRVFNLSHCRCPILTAFCAVRVGNLDSNLLGRINSLAAIAKSHGRGTSLPSLKSFVECAREQKQILRSPPPNWKAFGAPFTQNDSLSFDDSLSFAMNFRDRVPAAG